MAAQIIPISRPSATDSAWEEYAALAWAMQRNPALSTDRAHVEATVRAFDNFRKIYIGGAK